MREILWILFLAFFQNVSFSVVSRSRNRNNLTYHLFAATASNTVWYLTFRELVTSNMSFVLFLPYTIGTVAGSLSGVKVSMWIETWLGAASDSHIKSVSYLTKENLAEALTAITSKLAHLEGRVVQVYSRSLRKMRSQMQWAKSRFVTHEQLALAFDKIEKPKTAFEERTEIVRKLAPEVSFSARTSRKATRRWINFDRAGQLRLGLEE